MAARESIFASAHMFNAKSLLELIQTFNNTKGELLAQSQKDLYDLKRNIALASKKNFTLERDIRNLDKKIALLVKNRLTLEEVLQSGDISLINKNTTFKDQNRRRGYGKLFYLLQTDTRYIARLAGFVKIGEIDNLLQTVMFTLYGNQYDEYEEHLLLSMFQQVLEIEFQSSKSLSSLLRANTAISRMMTTYTRRAPGQQYLKQTLTNCLTVITSNDNMQLEVNPLKVYEQMINDYEATTGQLSKLNRKASPEEAGANPEVQKLLKARFELLGKLTDDFINDLIGSIANVPYGIRWICKQIKSLVKKFFPEATKANICSMIGGFFLLRFINPAIVTPQAFMLVDSKLSAAARRNLTLLAKIMQNLANNVQFGGVKEYYMGPLNNVLERNRDRLNEFLSELTNVSDLNDHLSMDRYIALGKTDKPSINISLNELYFIHALLKDHLESITVEAENNAVIKQILQDLGAAPAQLPRKDNANIDLELDNALKINDEAASYSTDQVYTETKYLLLVVLKTLPPFNCPPNVSIDDLILRSLNHAREKGNHSLYESVERLKENCKCLVKEGVLRVDDDYSGLRKDTVLELMNHEDLLEKTKTDLERLKGVLLNIQEHHNFLQEQFDAFKEYLNNVRSKSNVESRKSDKKSDKKEKKLKAKGPFKYTHNTLMKDGVITESSVPEDRRSSIFFVFSSSSPGVFDVVVMFGRRHIAKITLQLDDLLEKQQNNELVYETEFLKLNVNLLIHILNRDFMA